MLGFFGQEFCSKSFAENGFNFHNNAPDRLRRIGYASQGTGRYQGLIWSDRRALFFHSSAGAGVKLYHPSTQMQLAAAPHLCVGRCRKILVPNIFAGLAAGVRKLTLKKTEVIGDRARCMRMVALALAVNHAKFMSSCTRVIIYSRV